MSNKDKTVSEIELNAYIDGELDETDILRIEAYLAENPDIAEGLRYDRLINSSIHRMFDPVLCEGVPEDFYKHAIQKNRYIKKTALSNVAILAGMMFVSGVSGWMINAYHQSKAAPVLAHLVQPAAFAHVVYSTDPNHPVEFNATEKVKLSSWISERMHTPISAPRLTDIGYELIGGRLLPSTNRMAAQFMYQNKLEERITLYIRRNAWDGEKSNFIYTQENGVGVFYWYDGTMGYAVLGEINRNKLIVVAQAVQKSLTNIGVAL